MQPAVEGLRRDDDGFRPDVEGLRGVAVLLVVLFHAGLPVAGGFIGVDVFFVISGFLITGLLLREHEHTGRVSLTRFYARRMRRLLPAAAVVLVLSLWATWVLVGPLDRPDVVADGASAALSMSNIRFALSYGDYFAAISQPSPFLHFWSLSVEEQFYFVWPALLLLAGRGRRAVIGALLIAVVVGSFATNLALTHSELGWAFYSLPARAWQLAAGGLLAVAAGRFGAPNRFLVAVGGVAGWAALGAVVIAGLVLSESLPYPGLAAVVPTVGSALLIATGTIRSGPGIVLASRPFRFLGRISYSLYLWHWPILVFAPLAAGRTLGLDVNAGLVVAAIAAGWASWRFVEEPFRRGRLSIARGTRRVLASGLAAIALVAFLAGTVAYGSVRAIDEIGVATVDPAPLSTTPDPTQPVAMNPTRSPANTSTPTRTPTLSATPEPPAVTSWTEIPDVELSDRIPLPADVRPALAAARKDKERIYPEHCAAQLRDVEPAGCVYGDPHGRFTIALVGDSHAGEWFSAFEALASAHGWRLVPYVKVSCPFIDMPVIHFDLKREYVECATWRANVIADLRADPPDVTVFGFSHRGIYPALASEKGVEPESQALARAIRRIPGPHIVMIDTPRTTVDIPGCIASHPKDLAACAIQRATAFTKLFGVREARVAELTGADLIDLTPTVCPAMPCQVVRDGMIVYRDNHHLTATFSASLAPALEAAFGALPAGR
jgi:peptidoglycan/LPS O-acetylase OafA/YrhL